MVILTNADTVNPKVLDSKLPGKFYRISLCCWQVGYSDLFFSILESGFGGSIVWT
jgi:hypothetical protein